MALFDLFKRKKPAVEEAPQAEASGDSSSSGEATLPPAGEVAERALPGNAAIDTGKLPAPPSVTAPPSRMRVALNRTRAFLATTFATDPTGLVDEAHFAEIEDALVLADVSVELAAELISALRRRMADRGLVRKAETAGMLREVVAARLNAIPPPPALNPAQLAVIMLVGVNGSGKTTLAAKLAARLKAEGRRVLLAAADTFRAAAVEQLQIWAQRAAVDIVSGQTGADPASVVFDAVQAAQARGVEALIIDTAGRLQTKHNLMQELEKVTRTVDKAQAGGGASQIARILVLDATVGQNALSQAQLFNECCALTGLAVTKLDGTAKGGAVLTVACQLDLPVLYVGVGEQLGDLLDFDSADFAAGMV
jgi:fused signal recognition particle receptor